MAATKILSIKKSGFGVEIADQSVKVLQLQKKGSQFVLRGKKTIDLPEGSIEKGDIKDMEAVSAAIVQARKEAKPHPITVPYAAFSLPQEKTFYRILELPPMNDDEIGEAIRWKIDSLTPWDESLEYDWQLVKKGTDKLSVFASAVKRETVDNLNLLANKTELTPTIFDLEEAATVRTVVPTKAEEEVLVVDVGKKRSLFTAVHSGNLIFTAESDLSGTQFTKHIASGMETSEVEAEKMKLKCCSPSSSKQDKQIIEILEPLFETFAKETVEIIDYLKRDRHISDVEKIILCGGSSNLAGFAPYITLKLPYQVELANPWSTIPEQSKKLSAKIKPEEALSLVKVLGLAIRALDPLA